MEFPFEDGIEKDGGEQEGIQGDLGREFPDDVPWSFRVFVAVGSGEIPIGLVLFCLGEEVVKVAEVFAIIEFRFDTGMGAFDIGIGIGTAGRIEAVLGAEEANGAGEVLAIDTDLIAFEFRPIVGLDDDSP
jgi:hypothetical protein